MQSRTEDRAQIMTLPPLIYLVVFGLALLLERLWPAPGLSGQWAVVVGAVLILIGLVSAFVALRTLLRARTAVNPYKSTTAIVSDGLYRYSRNPIYVADMMLYFGASLVLHTVWPFVLTPLLLVIMNAGVIAREEAYLEQKFGEQYLSYKRKVRRWI